MHVLSALLAKEKYVFSQNELKGILFGAWLSLVEHLVRDQGVAGSNPVAPMLKAVNGSWFIVHGKRKNLYCGNWRG